MSFWGKYPYLATSSAFWDKILKSEKKKEMTDQPEGRGVCTCGISLGASFNFLSRAHI